MKSNYPLISCICLNTKSSFFLKEAINDFKSQNYLNKELIICFSKNDGATNNLIANYSGLNPEIKGVEKEFNESDEEATRKAIQKSSGDYICFWSDKDRHHSSRISYQYHSMMSAMQGHQASVLTRIVLYDLTSSQTYLSPSRAWNSTLFIKKELLNETPFSVFKEENFSIPDCLYNKKLLLSIENAPFLYVNRDYINPNKTPRKILDIYENGESLGPEYKKFLTDLI